MLAKLFLPQVKIRTPKSEKKAYSQRGFTY